VNQVLLDHCTALRADLEAARVAMDLTNQILIERVGDVAASRAVEFPMLHYLDANDLAAELWLQAKHKLSDFCQKYPEIC